MNSKTSGLIRFLRKSKIQTRLLWAFLAVSLIPVLFVGIYAYDVYTDSINTKLSQSAEQTVKLLNATLHTELKQYAFYINSLSISDMIQDILSEPPQEEFALDSVEVRDIRGLIEETTIQPAYLKNIRIADRNGNVLYDLGFDDVRHEQYREILNYVDASSPSDSLRYVKTFRSADMIVLGRKIYRYASSGDHIGYILVYINEKMLHDLIYADITFGENSNILLINHDGTVISSKNGEMLGTSMARENAFIELLEAKENEMASFSTEISGESHLVIFKYNVFLDGDHATGLYHQ